MASRALSPEEERMAIRRIRRIKPRDRALISAELFPGYRISETLKLRIGHVLKNGRIVDAISLPPRCLKGGYGGTRVVPVGPELRRALEAYLVRRAKHEELRPEAPLFVSRHHASNGDQKPLSRSSAEKIIKRILLEICNDKTGLSTHSLRKTFAMRVYRSSNNDLLVVRDALGHSSVAVTQIYVPTSRERVLQAIRRGDWTRRSQRSSLIIGGVPKTVAAPTVECIAVATESPAPAAAAQQSSSVTDPTAPQSFLPGFECFAV